MKTKHLRMKKSIKLLILLWGAMAFGQDQAIEGEIHSIKENGLYRIPITQKVRSYATTDLRGLRIWDAKGNQVPYFIRRTTAYQKTNISDFKEFLVISSIRIADTTTTYTFKNPNKTIKQAVLLIANYQGSKNYRLEGSNDQKQWFGIVNRGQLHQLSHATQTSVYKVIDFPLCAYQYIKVVFDDSNTLPINLLKVGEATAETITTVPITLDKIPTKALKFLEKDQITQIHVNFERKEVINQIRIAIVAPDLYSRRATLYTVREREVKRSIKSYRKQLASFSIRSDKELVFDIPVCIESEMYLEIDNKDNPKLQINGIHFMQEPMYLVAFLSKGEKYKFTAGDEALNFPNYDISDVTNTLKNSLPIAKISSVTYVQHVKPTKKIISFWQQSWFMWCCIGFAAVIILYFTFNLIKELNSNKED